MRKEFLALLVLCACGGGGSSSNSSTTVNQCTFDVEKGEVAEIVQAAEDSGAEVIESSSPESVSEPIDNDLQGGVIRISGTIVSGCGSEINANETENNVTQAQRLKKLIFAGEVLRLEVQ